MQTSLKKCVEAFERMQKEGWNTSQPMKWGFFFCDTAKDKLSAIFAELEESFYTLEDIYQVENETAFWTLHVSKIDMLTPDKLFRRNTAFNELAEYCGVDLYDGWDVEQLR